MQKSFWRYIYGILDHGASISITVTKTGIEDEIIVMLSPVPNAINKGQSPPLPAVFKGTPEEIDKDIVESLTHSQFGQSVNIFRNQEQFDTLMNSYAIISEVIGAGIKQAASRGRFRELYANAKVAWKQGKYDKALEYYTAIRTMSKNPSKETEERIRLCIEHIAKRDRIQGKITPYTDPFKKQQEGFGKLAEENE